jgi:hypothetical protein
LGVHLGRNAQYLVTERLSNWFKIQNIYGKEKYIRMDFLNSAIDTINDWLGDDADGTVGDNQSFIEKHKKSIIQFVIVVLVGAVGMYLFLGEDTDATISEYMKQMEKWIGGLLLGRYLTSSGELSTTKNMNLEEDVPVDINEMISL